MRRFSVALDRRQFLAGSALTAAAIAVPGVARAADGTKAVGAVVESVPSPDTLAVFLPGAGVSRTLRLAPGATAVHGRAGVVRSFEAFSRGERVVFIAEATGEHEIAVSEISSLVQSEVIEVSADGPTVSSDRGRFLKSANLRGAVPRGRNRAVYWEDPDSGDRYLCAARKR
jgi:hypothetical protein